VSSLPFPASAAASDSTQQLSGGSAILVARRRSIHREPRRRLPLAQDFARSEEGDRGNRVLGMQKGKRVLLVKYRNAANLWIGPLRARGCRTLEQARRFAEDKERQALQARKPLVERQHLGLERRVDEEAQLDVKWGAREARVQLTEVEGR